MTDVVGTKQRVFLESIKAIIADLNVVNAQLRAELAVAQELLQEQTNALIQKTDEVAELRAKVADLMQEVEALQRPAP